MLLACLTFFTSCMKTELIGEPHVMTDTVVVKLMKPLPKPIETSDERVEIEFSASVSDWDKKVIEPSGTK